MTPHKYDKVRKRGSNLGVFVDSVSSEGPGGTFVFPLRRVRNRTFSSVTIRSLPSW